MRNDIRGKFGSIRRKILKMVKKKEGRRGKFKSFFFLLISLKKPFNIKNQHC